MFNKIIQSRALVFVLLCSFVSLIFTEAMPLEQISGQVDESTPVFKVKAYGKKISPAQKKTFEQIIAEGLRLLKEEMDYEGAIIQFKEAEALAVTQPQKSDAYFYLSLAYYTTIVERGEEDFKETVRRLLEVDYYRELDTQLCPPKYIDLFQGIKAEYGVMRVRSRPPDADVYINEWDESSGKTPLTIGIKAGSIDIKVKKRSKEKKDTLEVTAGQRTTSPIYVLKRKSGLLFVLGGIALAAGVGAVLFLGKKKDGGGKTSVVNETFEYTSSQQTWTVPDGVTSITIDARGAQGGNQTSPSSTGGKGGRAQATIPVTPGATLYIYVGGAGSSINSATAGGFNGGGGTNATGYNPGTGGGASDVRIGSYALSHRVIVAGGGGGGGDGTGYSDVTDGGTGGGSKGGDGEATGGKDYNGKGGTQSAGGAGGSGSSYSLAKDGSLGQGGRGDGYSGGGGGGGGGYYGGGGGYGFAGGGGSGYVGYAGSTNTSMTNGYNSGDGLIIITNYPVSRTVRKTVQNNPSSKGIYNSREKFDDKHTSRTSKKLIKESIQDKKSSRH